MLIRLLFGESALIALPGRNRQRPRQRLGHVVGHAMKGASHGRRGGSARLALQEGHISGTAVQRARNAALSLSILANSMLITSTEITATIRQIIFRRFAPTVTA
jgi:hypothetical protein